MSDEQPSIANESQGMAVITISFNPTTGNLQVNYPMNEMVCRFMMDKAKVFLDDQWRMHNAPKVVPANGMRLRPLHG